MNLNDSELEHQLRLMRPRPASAGLESRIASALRVPSEASREAHAGPPLVIRHLALGTPSAWSRWLQGFGWALAGAAAAVAAIVFLDHRETSPAPAALAEVAAEVFEPTESTEELVTAEDEGLVLDSDQEPVRQVRYHSLERHVWVNPQTGARMEFEIPREDVRFISVAMQ